jgi:hypothetical protein
MAFGSITDETKPQIDSGVDQVPFSVGLNGVVPFLIRGNVQAYVVEKDKTTNN